MLINTDTTDMDSQLSHVAQLAEMNLAVRLLWWHGYRLRDLGTRSEVFDVVGHTGSGLARVTSQRGKLVLAFGFAGLSHGC